MIVTRLRAGAAGLLLVVALAACSGAAAPSGVASLGSPGAGETASAAPAASLDPETARLEFARCMREHGVDLPDPGPAGGPGVAVQIGGDGIDVQKTQAAFEACRQFAGGPIANGEIDPEMQDKLLEFAGCMRDHGVDFPDPTTGGGTLSVGGPGDIDPSSKAFQEAQEACRSILGDVGPSFEGSGPVAVPAP